jgi:hypothetical protein
MRVVIVLCVLAVVAAHVFMHTGSRAASLCAEQGAAIPDGLSLLPPGVRCSGGEPVTTSTHMDPTVLLVAPGLVLLVLGASALVADRRRTARL